jgi:hypothetical protein
VLTAGCSSGPSAAAKAVCGSVHLRHPGIALTPNQQFLAGGKSSGYPALGQAFTKFMNLHKQHSGAGLTAESQLAAACKHLGIPLGTPAQ